MHALNVSTHICFLDLLFGFGWEFHRDDRVSIIIIDCLFITGYRGGLGQEYGSGYGGEF